MNLTQAGQWGAVGTKSGPPGPSEGLGGPQKGISGPKRALLGPPGAQKGPDTRSECVFTMNLTQAGQWGAVGTKSGPPGPSEGLGGPQKGISGPKRALLGPPGAQKGPDTRSECVFTMNLTQAGQWGAVGTKSGPWGPPRTLGAPKRAFWGQNEPRWVPKRPHRGPK